ncbi:MAG: hypothetical protein KatS3mg023_3902 [Armatimonadota bacterium]|nr:MAG: hypothetical protein KatS3mg023_3902 [Armatimonadota bacterium]
MPAGHGQDWYKIYPYHPGTLVATAALLKDDAPIGSATVMDTDSQSASTGLYLWSNENYSGSGSVHYRVRIALYSQNALANWLPQHPFTYQYPTYNRYMFCALIIKSGANGYDLPDYDPNDGTSAGRMFSLPSGYIFTVNGARMIRCDGTSIDFNNISGGYPHLYKPVVGASPNEQHPCQIDIAGDDPVNYDIMWELEFAYTDPSPTPSPNQPITYYSTQIFAMSILEYQYPGYQPVYQLIGGVNIYVHYPYSPPPPASIPIGSLHNLDNQQLFVGGGRSVRRLNLFALSMLDHYDYVPSGYSIVRVRHLPRHKGILLLARSDTQTGGNYAFKTYFGNVGETTTTEVLSLSAADAIVEVSERRRETLLVYMLSTGEVYSRKSLDGGWNFGSAQRCTLGGSNMNANALLDLDYSVRRDCYLMVFKATDNSVKLLISEDGVNWTDTGV